MNKLNPLYILFLFFVITFLSYFTLYQKENLYYESSQEVISFTKIAKNYHEIKNSWLNSKKIEKRINNLIKSFKNEKISKIKLSDSIKIKYKSNNNKKLSKFLNKLLNDKFVFINLKITQKSVSAQIRLK